MQKACASRCEEDECEQNVRVPAQGSRRRDGQRLVERFALAEPVAKVPVRLDRDPAVEGVEALSLERRRAMIGVGEAVLIKLHAAWESGALHSCIRHSRDLI